MDILKKIRPSDEVDSQRVCKSRGYLTRRPYSKDVLPCEYFASDAFVRDVHKK